MRQREAARKWVNTHGNYSASNFYSRENRLYSYGDHYVIAEAITTKRGRHVYIFNNKKVTPTTSVHQSYAYSAIKETGRLIFHIKGGVYNGVDAIPGYIEEINSHIKASALAYKYRDEYLEKAEGVKNEMAEYVYEFDLRSELSEEQKTFIDNPIPEPYIREIVENARLKRRLKAEESKRKNYEALQTKEDPIRFLARLVGMRYRSPAYKVWIRLALNEYPTDELMRSKAVREELEGLVVLKYGILDKTQWQIGA